MINLSLALSKDLAKAATYAAKKLGMPRTQFIRQAIIHEVDSINIQEKQKAIIESFNIMRKSAGYLKETEKILNNFNSDLISLEEDNWWKKH